MKVRGGMTEVLWWHSTRAGTAHRRIRHSSHLLASPKQLLQVDDRKGNLHNSRRPRFEMPNIPILRQSNNHQGDRRTLVRGVLCVVAHRTHPGLLRKHRPQTKLYPGCSPSPIFEPSLDFIGWIPLQFTRQSTLSTYCFRLSCDSHRLGSYDQPCCKRMRSRPIDVTSRKEPKRHFPALPTHKAKMDPAMAPLLDKAPEISS